MAAHARSPSTDSLEARAAKRAKTKHGAPSLAERLDPTPRFASGLFDSAQALHKDYKSSGPYLHAVVDKLFQDDLLTNVKDEIIGQLSFTEKETDIYKVRILVPTATVQTKKGHAKCIITGPSNW